MPMTSDSVVTRPCQMRLSVHGHAKTEHQAWLQQERDADLDLNSPAYLG
jgi:hypothetical protein